MAPQADRARMASPRLRASPESTKIPASSFGPSHLLQALQWVALMGLPSKEVLVGYNGPTEQAHALKDTFGAKIA